MISSASTLEVNPKELTPVIPRSLCFEIFTVSTLDAFTQSEEKISRYMMLLEYFSLGEELRSDNLLPDLLLHRK